MSRGDNKRMSAHRTLFLTCWLLFVAILAPAAQAQLFPSTNGALVYDAQDGVTWLANADLPNAADVAQNPGLTFGVQPCSASVTSDCINPSGSMDWAAAVQYVTNMNTANYLGHSNWQLPAAQTTDPGCTGLGPNHDGFAFNCSQSGFGSLYYKGLGLTAPNSVQPVVQDSVGPFRNLQPSLYWSGTKVSGGGGNHTFSFGTGWRGLNVSTDQTDASGLITRLSGNFLFVLPMAPCSATVACPSGGTGLQLSADGNTVYDPVNQVVWAANGDLASDLTLDAAIGMPICNGLGSQGITLAANSCVNADGTMTVTSAAQFIADLNAADYENISTWQLPPSLEAGGCGYTACSDIPTGASGPNPPATKDPMATLFYNSALLDMMQGQSIVPALTAPTGPFIDMQPEYYWACVASNNTEVPAAQSPCSYATPQCTPGPSSSCANDMEWSFNLLSGYTDTDELVNNLFVEVYFVPEPSSLVVLMFGLAAVAGSRRRRANRILS